MNITQRALQKKKKKIAQRATDNGNHGQNRIEEGMVESEADSGDGCLQNHEEANLANQLLIPEQRDEGHRAQDKARRLYILLNVIVAFGSFLSAYKCSKSSLGGNTIDL